MIRPIILGCFGEGHAIIILFLFCLHIKIAKTGIFITQLNLALLWQVSYFSKMNFDIVGQVTESEIIAIGNSIREIKRLRKVYGEGRWRKLKGFATIKLANGTICKAELHWYEAHGIGKKEFKIKRIL